MQNFYPWVSYTSKHLVVSENIPVIGWRISIPNRYHFNHPEFEACPKHAFRHSPRGNKALGKIGPQEFHDLTLKEQAIRVLLSQGSGSKRKGKSQRYWEGSLVLQWGGLMKEIHSFSMVCTPPEVFVCPQVPAQQQGYFLTTAFWGDAARFPYWLLQGSESARGKETHPC